MAFARKCVECWVVKDGQAFSGPAGRRNICSACQHVLKHGRTCRERGDVPVTTVRVPREDSATPELLVRAAWSVTQRAVHELICAEYQPRGGST